jgi:molecular chaperone GrpE
VIRDKRKVSPSPAGNKAVDSQEANGSEVTASEPVAEAEAATTTAETATPSGQDAATGEAAPAQEASEQDVHAPEGKAEPAEPAEKPAAEEPAEPVEAVVVEAEPTGEPTVGSAELGELRSALDERTADLQRITAEYANYRKRMDRDRAVAGEAAVKAVLEELLPVLDDIDRARDHGDLTGPFAAIADKLTTVTSKFSLTAFGEKGDPFDPNLHDAVAHQTSSEVTESTCVEVMRRGYLLGERLLRPALVAVADPESE